MFPWSLSKKSTAVVGVEYQSEGMAVVQQELKDGVPSVSAMDFLRFDGASAQLLLKAWVEKHRLEKSRCNVVLGADAYQLLLVEPPEVPFEEMREAIRWRLKDLVSIPVEQAVVDIFMLPEDGTRSNKKMVYVVAADKAKIKSVIDCVNHSGLELEAIDIIELAMRNVSQRLICDSMDRGIAIARLRQGSGSVYLFRQGNMYLARNFALDYNGGLLDDLPEDILALELQRSLDYYERQMGQVPPSVVYVCGENVSEDKIGATLKSSLAANVQFLDPAATAMVDGEPDNSILQSCVAALGGALRDEQAA